MGPITVTQFQGAFTSAFSALTTSIGANTAATDTNTAATSAASSAATEGESLNASAPQLTQQELNNELSSGTLQTSGTPIAANDPSWLASGDLLTAIQQMEQALSAPDLSNKLSALDPNNPDNILGPGGTPAITLAPVFNFGTVVGSNAAQQLVNLVMPQMVAQLRQAGVKI